jgi:repressor LexA
MLGEKIRMYRKKRGFSQEYIAEKLGYKSFTTIQKWESNDSEPSMKILRKLSLILGVTMHELTSEQPDENWPPGAFPPPHKKRIPILGRISAGAPMYAVENIEGYEWVDDESLDYGLIVKGDSMIGARICDGDVIFVDNDAEVRNGDVIVALINGDDALVKRYYRYGEEIILRPENPTLPEQHYRVQEVQILGKVKEFHVKL